MKLTKQIKNRIIRFVVTDHAYQRFAQRIRRVEAHLLPHEILQRFVAAFRESTKLKRQSKSKQIRDERYEGTTIYYRNKDFNFIVQDDIIITVEFNGKKKHLNRRQKPRLEYASSRG